MEYKIITTPKESLWNILYPLFTKNTLKKNY
jgi:hypothetical protein